MTNEFELNFVEYGDTAGLGAYEIGHYRQHRNYVDALAKQNVIIQDVPILRMLGDNPQELQQWLNDHEGLHELLRSHAGITGTNLADLNPFSAEEFYQWLDAHASEHRSLDIKFGTT